MQLKVTGLKNDLLGYCFAITRALKFDEGKPPSIQFRRLSVHLFVLLFPRCLNYSKKLKPDKFPDLT